MYEPLEYLNSYQKDAVINNDRVLLLNAGVGSGKTTVLVSKVLYLYHCKNIKLKDMVVLTFTNKAAEEIKERVLSSDISGKIERRDLSLFGTFHSVARHLLSTVLPVEDLGYTKDFTILDQNDTEELFDRVISKYKLKIKYRKKLEKRLEAYKSGVSLYGNMKYEDEIETFLDFFDQEKKNVNVMDFGDLIKNAAVLLHRANFKPSWVIIDEFQDTDREQLKMVDCMIGRDTNVFAVGDPNQIIYTWRGSSGDIFNTFKEMYNAVEKNLPVNYRSTGTIIEAARAFIEKPQSLEGVREKGASIVIKRHYNSFNEALYLVDTIRKLREKGVNYKEIAIFYRMQKQSAVFEDVLKKHNIPYEVSLRKSLKDIPVLNWLVKLLKASVNSRDIDSLAYILKDDRYGLGMTARQASGVIKTMENSEDDNLPELVKKVLGFKNWCDSRASCAETTEQSIYDYFDMDNYISPTSIYYDEDRELIPKFLNELLQYSGSDDCPALQGIRKAIDYSSLYGGNIIKEIIHPGEDSVKLMTLHASKGLEFKHVFISGVNYGIIPVGTRLEDEEEKRLFFVGITRAKDFLEISYHANPDDPRVLPVPSPYLKMIPEELIESEELKSRAHTLSGLRKEIKSKMENKPIEEKPQRKKAQHPKYGTGYVVSEDEDNIVVDFEGYGEKSFLKAFCPLKFEE